MEIIIQPNSDVASRLAARLIAKRVREKPDAVLGLATGGTPRGLYRELIRIHHEENLDFSGVRTFNLDEYVGLAPDHPASYHRFMAENLFDHINISKENIYIPDGLTQDIPAYCAAYEQAIQSVGGIDVQLLGIGVDGHLGFNEPSSSLASRTRIKTLTRQTREHNASFFGDNEVVPAHVITMGIGTIMESRECLLLAFGKHKATSVAQMVEGPLTAMVPASILQIHPSAKVFMDEAAASRLTRSDYYRWVYEHKPDWQQIQD